MWKPKKIVFKNFLSHSDSEYSFADGVATMIHGINADDEAQESNGSGKSVMIEAIAFALTGDSLRGVRAIELIKDGQDHFEVELSLENARLDRSMTISRKQPAKGSSKVSVFINEEEQKDKIPTVRVADEFILGELDITKEDLFNYFIISKDKYQSFFSYGDVKKKQVVARFSNASLMDEAYERCDENIKAQKQIVYLSEQTCDRIKTKIETLKESIANADVKSGMDKYTQGTELLKQRIVKGKDVVKQEKQKITLAIGACDTHKKREPKKADDSKVVEEIKKVNERLQITNTDLTGTRDDVQEASAFVAELERLLIGSVLCPKCSHEFVPKAKEGSPDPKEARETLPEAKELYKTLQDIAKAAQKTINELHDKRESLIQTRAALQDKENEWKIEHSNLSADLTAMERALQSYKDGVANLQYQLDNYQKPVDPTKALNEQLETYMTSQTDALKSLSAEEQLLNADSTIQFLFKRFKTHLANKAIRSIEAYTTYYLDQIKTNLGLKMSGYKLKADGTLSEKISCVITRNGDPIGPFSRFSGGEKVRVEICNIIALQNLINLNAKSGGLDLLCLDEIIESVDSTGVVEVMKALNLLKRTVLVITHTTHNSVYENVVVVEKNNGNSKILN